MWRNALFATAATLMGLLLLIFSQLDFLIPYKRLLLHHSWQKPPFTSPCSVSTSSPPTWR